MPERLVPRAGLLPVILELYDRQLPELRVKQQELVNDVSRAMEAFATVQRVDICASKAEVEHAVEQFEKAGCDAVVVLFTAYAPSLIAADPLAGSELPVVIFNTQVAYELDRSNLTEALLRNHGMHGVQDLASVLLRKGKPYSIVTGHHSSRETLEQLKEWLTACALKRQLKNAAVGVIGKPFEGMGDFSFDPQRLRQVFGTRVEQISQEEIVALADRISDKALNKAIAQNTKGFVLDPKLTKEELRVAVAMSVAILKKLESALYCAWSMNFLDVAEHGILPSVPFLAASRSLERGYGYAGEGDALSALCVFIAQQLCPPASFTEMFCMDPRHGSVLLSHMGEANWALASGEVHLAHKEFAFGECTAPATPVFAFKPGEATLINLLEGPGGKFRFITASVDMQDWPVNLQLQSPQGYMKPRKELSEFLTEYSMLGGTHHLALAYGDNSRKVAKFAALCGVECFHIQ